MLDLPAGPQRLPARNLAAQAGCRYADLAGGARRTAEADGACPTWTFTADLLFAPLVRSASEDARPRRRRGALAAQKVGVDLVAFVKATPVGLARRAARLAL